MMFRTYKNHKIIPSGLHVDIEFPLWRSSGHYRIIRELYTIIGDYGKFAHKKPYLITYQDSKKFITSMINATETHNPDHRSEDKFYKFIDNNMIRIYNFSP